MRKLEAVVEWVFLRGGTLSSLFKISLLVAFVPVLLALPFVGRNMESHRVTLRTPVFSRANHHGAGESLSAFQSDSPFGARPLLPYSVIPGGVESERELRNAMHDPVVADHYADFNLAKARIIRLDHDEREYVSYRIGDRIYWTKRQLALHKGETLITDGTHEARTRCGNRLSETAEQPTSAAQPPPAVLESPAAAESPATPPALFALNYPPVEIPETSAPLIPPTETSPGGPTGEIIPPVYFPIVGGGAPPSGSLLPPPGGGGSSPGAPGGSTVGAPEPGSLVLMMAGVGSLLALARRKKRQS
jgi:hypothetical protein